MRRRKLWTGLSSILSVMLSLSIIGTTSANSYASVVNSVLGVSTSKIVELESEEEIDTAYFKSGYGELNADNLKKLKADTYDQAVKEQEEGTVLLKNENLALPLAADERSVTLFGHATVQPIYRNQSAGSRAYAGWSLNTPEIRLSR